MIFIYIEFKDPRKHELVVVLRGSNALDHLQVQGNVGEDAPFGTWAGVIRVEVFGHLVGPAVHRTTPKHIKISTRVETTL